MASIEKFGIDTIDTFAAKYRYYRYRHFFLDLFYVEKNLIKISCVRRKHSLAFSGSSIRVECELAMATSLIQFAFARFGR